MGDSILRKTNKTLSKGEYVVVCIPGARIEYVPERVENTLGHGQGGSIISTYRDNVITAPKQAPLCRLKKTDKFHQLV